MVTELPEYPAVVDMSINQLSKRLSVLKKYLDAHETSAQEWEHFDLLERIVDAEPVVRSEGEGLMEVKPCPFCGAKPKVWDRVAEVGGGDIQDVFLIQCVNVDCGVKPQVIIGGERGYGPVSWEENHTNDEAAALVVVHWNYRFQESVPDGNVPG